MTSSPALPVPADTSLLGAHVRDGGTSSDSGRPGQPEWSSRWLPRTGVRPTTTCSSAPTASGRCTCPESDRSSATGSESTASGTRPPALGSTQPSCCSTRTPGRSPAAWTTPGRSWTTYPASDYIPDRTDSAAAVPLSVVVGDTPPPTPIARPRPLAETRDLRAARQGLHPAASGRAGAPARDVRGAGLPGGDPAPDRPGGDRGGAAAGPPPRLRTVRGRPRTVELLGVQHPGLLRPALGVRLGRHAGPAGAGVQGDGLGAARRRASR